MGRGGREAGATEAYSRQSGRSTEGARLRTLSCAAMFSCFSCAALSSNGFFAVEASCFHRLPSSPMISEDLSSGCAAFTASLSAALNSM